MRSSIEQTLISIQPLAEAAQEAARRRQEQLTKPQGSLGRLEALALQIAGISGQARPRVVQPALIVMAADHGVAGQNVSAYPQAVTAQMVGNFLAGGAAINVLARHINARLIVADIGVAADLPAHPQLRSCKLGPGTADIARGAAMSHDQAQQALEIGIELAAEAIRQGADSIGTGDMGIGNTTASSAITATIAGRPAAEVTGRGTGIDDKTLANKIAIIEQALATNRPDPRDALDILARVGGFEIGGLAGVMLGAAARRVPVVIDGFISGAAALLATLLAPAVQPYLIAAHRSVERGHSVALEHLQLEPLLNLDLRLGEGTGAALGLSLCSSACKLLDEMATFGEAGVSEQTGQPA